MLRYGQGGLRQGKLLKATAKKMEEQGAKWPGKRPLSSI